MKICIQNGRIINPATQTDQVNDLWIEDGRVQFIGKKSEQADEVIDATGKWVVPGLIDLHVHFRTPGFEYKEDMISGTRAAAKGGFTTVCCMPNTNPVIDNECVVEYIYAMANRANGVHVLPIGAVTKGQQGEQLSDIGKMKEHGICAISEDGKTVMNSGLMKKAMNYMKTFDLVMMSHTEDTTLTGGAMNAGENAQRFGIKGIPREAEEIIVARDILLAKYTGCKLHLCHISTEDSVEIIRFAKSKGIPVTAETAPHYFTLDDHILEDYDTNKKMSPPLRTQKDVKAIQQALADGTLDVIATDHAPHHYDEKNVPFEVAPFGIVGLETSFSLSFTQLYQTGILSAMALIHKMSYKPAQIINSDKGDISTGKVADITIIDPNATYTVAEDTFVGKSKNSPFIGMTLQGEVIQTLVSGKTIYKK